MKESYHICFTSHDEVLFRSEEDHRMFVNLAALQTFRNQITLLADAEMSTHVHLNMISQAPIIFAAALRMSYTKWFNHRHDRKGRFGERGCYIQSVSGFYHQLTLLNYILRNGLHHGAVSVALGYPYCSIHDMFSKDIGYYGLHPSTFSRTDISHILPRHAEFPDDFIMDETGMFMRDSFMDIRLAEQYYQTPRNFLYQMNRLSSEEWEAEQLKDNTGAPITLQDIERVDRDGLAAFLRNENGRGFNPHRLQDLDLCKLIDTDYLPRFSASSVYQLSELQVEKIHQELRFDRRLPEAQIRRCLAENYPR